MNFPGCRLPTFAKLLTGAQRVKWALLERGEEASPEDKELRKPHRTQCWHLIESILTAEGNSIHQIRGVGEGWGQGRLYSAAVDDSR